VSECCQRQSSNFSTISWREQVTVDEMIMARPTGFADYW